MMCYYLNVQFRGQMVKKGLIFNCSLCWKYQSFQNHANARKRKKENVRQEIS